MPLTPTSSPTQKKEKKIHRLSITWLVVFPTAIFMLSDCIPFHRNPNQWVICLHKRVPFTSSHAGAGPQPEDLLIAHINFSPDVAQNRPTCAKRDVKANFRWTLDGSMKPLSCFLAWCCIAAELGSEEAVKSSWGNLCNCVNCSIYTIEWKVPVIQNDISLG